MADAVFGIANNQVQAVEAVEALRSAGFRGDDISVLLPDRGGTKDFAHEQHTKAPEGATAGAATGGILGAAAGWLVGIGSLAIPGLGPLVAAGPIMAALSGAAAGAAAGGLTGALVGAGIPEYEAKLYEGKIRDGNILISAASDDSDRRSRAKELFERLKLSNISTSSTSTPPRA